MASSSSGRAEPAPVPGIVAGVLLTGGASTRMGRDKASIRLAGSTLTLAERAGELLEAAVSPGPAIEVGPGSSRLMRAADLGVHDPGTGPLTAVVAGREALERSGFSGPVLVLATDLPWLTPEVLSWLVGFPGGGSVVPVVAGRSQPLCARWSVGDLGRAVALARQGERSVRDVFGPEARFAAEACWGRWPNRSPSPTLTSPRT